MSRELILKHYNDIQSNTLMETLDIVFTDVTADCLEAQMPVNPKIHQPMGILHGGATAALVETVGSAIAQLFIDREKQIAKGLEITVNHLKSVKSGHIRAKAQAIHLGRSTQIIQVDVFNETDERIAFGKMTNMILSR